MFNRNVILPPFCLRLQLVLICLAGAWLSATAQAGNIEDADAPLTGRIGQMLLVGFRGEQVPEGHPILRDIREHHLGGVVLFTTGPNPQQQAGNIASPAQLRTLTAKLQAAAPTPLLIAVDQEGGRIARLRQRGGFPPTVSAAFLGRHNNLALTRRHAAGIARTLRRAGINLNLAPVVDLNSNPDNPIIGGLDRSFSADPALVTAHAREVIRAHHAHGVLCALKHFPGHGSSTGDTHSGFVDVTAAWSRRELAPYRALIGEGLADSILTAHVFNARLDPAEPATLSPATINGLLRRELGYAGVVISDDLTMKAISERYPPATAIEKALRAGVDMLLIADNAPDTAARAIATIRQLVADGRISSERIRRSQRRIRLLKKRLNTIGQTGRQPPCPSSISSAAAVSAKPSGASGKRTAP